MLIELISKSKLLSVYQIVGQQICAPLLTTINLKFFSSTDEKLELVKEMVKLNRKRLLSSYILVLIKKVTQF